MLQLRPNCGGELVTRPRRPADKLARFPASTERVLNPKAARRRFNFSVPDDSSPAVAAQA